MKKIFLLFFIIFCSSHLVAQDTIHLKNKDGNSPRKVTITDRPPQAVYAELDGKGLLLSVNYDRRFGKQLDGLGFDAGIGYMDIDGLSLVTVPIGINYLLGHSGKYFECGVGATYLSATITDYSSSNSTTESGSTVVGTLTLGYRSQPVNGGFMFRAGIDPIFFKNNFFPFPYVSFGYNF